MHGQRKDPLRELLNREVEALAAEAMQVKDGVSAERIEAMGRLAKVIEMRDSLQPKPRSWWPAVVFAGTLAMVSLLLFARVRETEIELEVSVGQVSFALSKDQVLTGPLELSSLGVSGVRALDLPRFGNASAEETEAQGSSGSAASLTRASAGQRSGTVTLAPLPLPANTPVRLRRSELVNQYRLSTHADGLTLQAAVDGPITVGLANSPARKLDSPSPRPILLHGGSEDLDLDLTFQRMPQVPLSPQLAVRELSFLQIEQFLDPDRTMVRRLSTILSGTLYFESLNGQERRLRASEELQFARSQGEIRTLELADHHIGLQFHGRVQGMTTGTGEGRRSLMPTYLEWLQARHGLPLFWATSLYVFGLIAGALRWWGVRI